MRHQTPSQQRRASVDAVLIRITSDPAYRRQLLTEPARTHDSASALQEPPDVAGVVGCRCSLKTCRVSFITR